MQPPATAVRGIDLATIVNGGLTFVLICITAWYTILTRRSVKAAERSVTLTEAERLERRGLAVRRFRADLEMLRDQLIMLPGVGPDEWQNADTLIRNADFPSDADLDALRDTAILLGPDELRAATKIRTNMLAMLRVARDLRDAQGKLGGPQYQSVDKRDWNARYGNVTEGITQALAAADAAEKRIGAHSLGARLNAGD